MGTRSIQRLCRVLAVAALGLAVFAPVAAWAQADYPTNPTTTPTVDCTNPGNSGLAVCGTSVTNPPGVTVKAASTTGLAFTGGNIALLVGLGLVAAAGGVFLVRLGRRSHATR